jgi:formyl-CoA transferase/CoA:oxalate CoA-transferase
MPGPLDGFTVLDLTRVLSGPYCTMVLGDLGARVIKVEHPERGDDTRHWGPPFLSGESAYFLSINRNKESIAIDFREPDGRGVLDRLLPHADVVVENFRPGTLEPYGLDASSLRARFPRLVYCSISGYGQTGPRREEPGYDAVIQAEGGLMSVTGAADGPPFRLGVAISDIVSGLFAVQGVLAALVARERSGQGQSIDISMLDTTSALLTYQAGIHFTTGLAPTRIGNRHPNIAPYETFAASDGDVVVAVGSEGIWRRFCTAIGLPDLAIDERFATNSARVTNYTQLKGTLDPIFARETRAAWIERLKNAGVPCGSVRDIGELFRDPQLHAREMVATVPHATIGPVSVIGSPIKLSDTPASVRTAPPTLGQHADAILRELGYDAETIASLRERRVVA